MADTVVFLTQLVYHSNNYTYYNRQSRWIANIDNRNLEVDIVFCSKCGKQLTDGALFCSFCGSKVELENTAEPTGSYVIEKPSYEEDAAPAKQQKANSTMMFDWSNVIDESHKKQVPTNLRSPWDPTGLDEETAKSAETIMASSKKPSYVEDDFFVELEKPSTEPTRTMSFIDMLRAEREEKEKKAAIEASAVTEKPEEVFDYSAFEEKADLEYTQILPSEELEMTQGYTDLGSDLVAQINKVDEIATAESELDEYIRLRQEGRSEAAVISEPEEPQRFVASAEEQQKDIEAAYEDKTDLSAELAAILGAQNAFAVSEEVSEPKVDLFDDVASFGDRITIEDEDEDDVDISAILDAYDDEDEDAIEFDYDDEDEDEIDDIEVDDIDIDDVDLDSYAAEDSSAEESPEVAEYENLEFEEVSKEPKDDISSLIANILGEDHAAEAEPVEDELEVETEDEAEEVVSPAEVPSVEEPAEELSPVESEIEMLKRRLAELMGEDTEEPVAVETNQVSSVEELVAEESDDTEELGYDDIFSATLGDDEEEVDVLEEAAEAEPVIEIEEVAPAIEPTPVLTDEMSFDSEEETLDLDSELAALGFDLGDFQAEETVEPVVEAPVLEETAEPVVEVIEDAQDPFVGVEEAVHSAPEAEDEIAEATDEAVSVNDLVVEAVVPEEEAGIDAAAEFELEALLAQAQEEVASEPVQDDLDLETDAMSIEELERDLFGDGNTEDGEAEATRKIDKFYTLYKKNEEFQRLLDEEYSKLQGIDSSEDLDNFFEVGAEEKTDAAAEFAAQQQPIGQMSMPAAAEVEARSFIEKPAQSGTIDAMQEAPVSASKPAPVMEADEPKKLSKKELKAQKKAQKAAALEEDDEEEGGSALTIIAVVIAVLLVILLALIIVMNFAPDTGLGIKLNMFVENISSYFSSVDANYDDFLL